MERKWIEMTGMVEFSRDAGCWVWTCVWGCWGMDYEGTAEAEAAFKAHECRKTA